MELYGCGGRTKDIQAPRRFLIVIILPSKGARVTSLFLSTTTPIGENHQFTICIR